MTPVSADPRTVDDWYDVLDLMPLLNGIVHRCLSQERGLDLYEGGNTTFHGLTSLVPLVVSLREVHWRLPPGGHGLATEDGEGETIVLDGNAMS